MRILHLTTEFPPVIYGGLGTAVGGLVKASARTGMTVGVLLIGATDYEGYGNLGSSERTASDPERMVVDSSEATIFPIAWSSAIDASVGLVRKWRPDVVHMHAFWLSPIARAIREGAATPVTSRRR